MCCLSLGEWGNQINTKIQEMPGQSLDSCLPQLRLGSPPPSTDPETPKSLKKRLPRGVWDPQTPNARKVQNKSPKSGGEARGPGLLGGPSSWCFHAQTAHSLRKERAGTPSRAGTMPFPKRCRGSGPGRKGGSGGMGSACGVLWPVQGPEAWEYHEPGPPNEPGPLALPN